MVALPRPRGPLSHRLVEALPAPDHAGLAQLPALAEAAADDAAGDVVADDDVQVSLYVLYELWYRGFDGVDDRLEWHPDLLAARAHLERGFEDDLRRRVPVPPLGAGDGDGPTVRPAPTAQDVAATLFALTAPDHGPSLSRFVAKEADVDQVRELLCHRSVYQLKEADPHTWAIPRLEGPPKAALVEVQADEYGGGRPERVHAVLFARAMRALGLDATPGRYVDDLPAVTLAWANAMSLLGLHRRWRGAVAGHLAALEMTSSLPMRRYGDGLRRLGLGTDATEYFDEHVEADAVHEQIAGRDLAGHLVAQEPALLPDVLWGAAVALATDDWVTEHVLAAWADGRPSLRTANLAGA
jgi:hypothetical protein